MALEFHIGDPQNPKGHALIYFQDGQDPDKVGASYVVMLPVSVDIGKYVPPFLAGQVEQLGSGDMSSFAFPPAPELVPSEKWIKETAEHRQDDLIFGGVVNLSDVTALMATVADIAGEYGDLYERSSEGTIATSEPVNAVEEPPEQLEDVNDVMYGLMSETDLLTELTTLLGRLQYASSGGDQASASEAESKIRAISKHVPENRQIGQLLETALENTENSARKSQLYLERAFAMYREDYTQVHALEEEISGL
ncbi:MAG: hypothetical protein VW271_07645 [Chloroflexota bacterium]